MRQAARAARREIKAALAAGAVPAQLALLPIWKACRPAVLVPHQPRLLAAWLSGDPARWVEVLADANAAALRLAAARSNRKARK